MNARQRRAQRRRFRLPLGCRLVVGGTVIGLLRPVPVDEPIERQPWPPNATTADILADLLLLSAR